MIKLKDLLLEDYAYAEVYTWDMRSMSTEVENDLVKIAKKFGGELTDATKTGVKFEFDHRSSRDAFVKSAGTYGGQSIRIHLEG